MFLARLGIEAAAECALTKVGFRTYMFILSIQGLERI